MTPEDRELAERVRMHDADVLSSLNEKMIDAAARALMDDLVGDGGAKSESHPAHRPLLDCCTHRARIAIEAARVSLESELSAAAETGWSTGIASALLDDLAKQQPRDEQPPTTISEEAAIQMLRLVRDYANAYRRNAKPGEADTAEQCAVAASNVAWFVLTAFGFTPERIRELNVQSIKGSNNGDL